MNRDKLRGKIAEKNIPKRKISEFMGISVQALNMKLSGKIKINIYDAEKLCEILEIKDSKEKCEIFLQ